MNITERLCRFIIAIIAVPFILIALAFIGVASIVGMFILGFCTLFLPLAVLINPEILEIK